MYSTRNTIFPHTQYTTRERQNAVHKRIHFANNTLIQKRIIRYFHFRFFALSLRVQYRDWEEANHFDLIGKCVNAKSVRCRIGENRNEWINKKSMKRKTGERECANVEKHKNALMFHSMPIPILTYRTLSSHFLSSLCVCLAISLIFIGCNKWKRTHTHTYNSIILQHNRINFMAVSCFLLSCAR